MKEMLERIQSGKDLTRAQSESLMETMIVGAVDDADIKALLLGLNGKGAKPQEIAGFAHVVRKHAVPVSLRRYSATELVDVCGTGGDGAGTFNISTAVAFVVAGCGVPVAKHGNRSVSSRCGSSDVLEALGVKPDQAPNDVVQMLETIGLGFFFAPVFHPAFKRFAEVRRSIKARTVFNILGPLVNPAGVKRQVLGVFDASLLETIANTLLELGAHEVMVVAGEDGLDELTLTGKTQVAHLRDGKIQRYTVSPQDAGLEKAPLETLKGGDAKENAAILKAIFSGERGPKRDAVLLNSAAALVVSGKASDLRDGVRLAAKSLDEGSALAVLERLRVRS
jgi:anthranilate phosphoribosyltransferase